MNPGTKLVLCGEAAAEARAAKHALCLRNSGPDRNVHLQIDDISRTLATGIPNPLVDLIELATFVYVADQYFRRGGSGVEEMGANWRRSFHFEIPVRSLVLWQRDEVATALRDVLSFLSEDEYTFSFRQCQKPPPADGYINFSELDYAVKPQHVILLSGGLDSLGGAVREVVANGAPVALVRHQPTTKLLNRYRTMRAMLDDRAKGPRPLHVTVRINESERLNNEYTQRSRSFLYASLAAAVARMCNLDAIRFYENGTISLNLPISRQVVGAKATRTTHPRVLAGFSRLFSLLEDKPFTVENGYLWKTKEEVVREIVEAGCGSMIDWTTSCTRTLEMTNARPHCGRCSQCIDRRFAILAASAAHFDQADSYGVDLLTGAREEGEPRTMLASYVEVAQQVATMSEMDFFMRFGEVARIVRHLGGEADQNARKVYELYVRHAKTIGRVIDEALAQCASQIRARSLPEGSLLRMVHDPSVPGRDKVVSAHPVRATGPPVEAFMLRQRGEGWQLRFAGHEVLWFKPAIGFRYLSELLRWPGKQFTVSALLIAVHGSRAAIPLGDGGELADGQARVAYTQRLEELNRDIEIARTNNDIGNLAKYQEERDQVRGEMKRAWFKKRAKRSNSDLNNVRNSVCNAIKRAISAIEKYEPEGAEHLKRSISSGFSIRYNPAERVSWSL